MSLTKITNFAETAKNRLIQQDKDHFEQTELVGVLVSEGQEVENALYDVYTQTGVYTAIGVQLDVIGVIVGEARNGRTDTNYRLAILARIKLNVGSGEPNTIIDAVKQFMDTNIVEYSEPYPAYFTLFIQSNVNVANISSLVKEISPVCISSSVTTLPKNLTGFRFGTSKGQPDGFNVQATPLPTAQDNYIVDAIDTLQIESMKTITYGSNTGFGTAYQTKSLFVVDAINSEYDIGNGDILELKLTDSAEDYSVSIFGGRLSTVRT